MSNDNARVDGNRTCGMQTDNLRAEMGLEENPYRFKPAGLEQVVTDRATPGLHPTDCSGRISGGDEEADSPPTEAEDRRRQRRRRKKKVAAVLLLLLLVVGAVVIWLKLGDKTQINYRVKDQRARQAGPEARAGGGDGLTTEAVEQARTLIGSPTPTAAQPKGKSEEAGQGMIPPAPNTTAAPPAATNMPPIIFPEARPTPASTQQTGSNASSEIESARPSPASSRAGGSAGPVRSKRNPETSIYMNEPERAHTTSSIKPAPEMQKVSNKRHEVVLPSFGSMLPVRTLGAIYTLRSGSLARLELTRDIQGEGWALKKGTVLVAGQQGGEYDRAYLSIIGFIDPDTNRLVKLKGEVLGSDGAPGLKGKRRQVSSRWSRAFNRIMSVVPGLAQAALSRGNTTTIVMPAGAALPELSLYSAMSRREFVEVKGGTSAYVMVTDLPDAVDGA